MIRKWLNTLILSLLTFLTYTIEAQDIDYGASMAMADLELFEKHNTSYDSKKSEAISLEERLAKAKAYDIYVSHEFGSYLNPFNGNLYIINDAKKQFNRAQLIEESSNEKVFSIDINQDVKQINIKDYNPGEYILILSNDKGNILVENFIII